MDGAPHRALRGDRHRIGQHLERGDPERLEMRHPDPLVGKAALGVRDQAVDHRAGQMVPAHVGHCRLVDHVVVVTGAQAVEEVGAGLRQAGAEGREPAVADLGGDAVAPGVEGAGIVDGDPSTATRSIRSAPRIAGAKAPAKACARQARAQHLPILGHECVEPTGQQPHHLPLGDGDADTLEQRGQPLAGHLALDMAGQHEPAQRRAKATNDPGRKRRDDRTPVRRQPALAAVADHPRHQQQILDDDVLIALEARPGRRRCRQHALLANHQAIPLGTAPTLALWLARRLRRRRLARAFSIPDGFSFGRGDRPCSRATSSRRAAFSARSRATSANRLSTRDRSSPIASPSIASGSGSDMARVNHTPCYVQRAFCPSHPGFCPGYVQAPAEISLDLPNLTIPLSRISWPWRSRWVGAVRASGLGAAVERGGMTTSTGGSG